MENREDWSTTRGSPGRRQEIALDTVNSWKEAGDSS